MVLYKLVPERFRRWSSLAGASLIHFAVGSTSMSNLSPYVISYLRVSVGVGVTNADVVWLNTVRLMVQGLVGIVLGFFIAYLRISLRLSLFVGILFILLGNAVTYFSIKVSFYTTIGTLSVIVGIGVGLSYIQPLLIVIKWFPKSKGFAQGIVLLANGAVLFDQIETLFINPNNLPPALVVVGEGSDNKYFNDADLLARVPVYFLLMSGMYVVLQLIGFSLLCMPKRDLEAEAAASESAEKKRKRLRKINSLGVRYEVDNEGAGLLVALRTVPFYCLVSNFAFSNIGTTLIVTYTKVFGFTFINDDQFLALVTSLAGVFNALGHIIWGVFIDRFSFKLSFLTINTLAIAFISTIYFQQFTGVKEVYLIWICVINVLESGIYVIGPVTIIRCFGLKYFTAIQATLIVLGSPAYGISVVLGLLVNTIGYQWLFTIGSICSSIAWISVLLFNVKDAKGDDI